MAGSRREYLAADRLEIYGTMKLSSVTDAYPGPDPDNRPQFKVAIIYEDSAAGKRAKHNWYQPSRSPGFDPDTNQVST